MIWNRFVFKRLLLYSCLVLLVLFCLYVLIDFSTRFSKVAAFSLKDLLVYYGATFVRRLEILGPFSFLLALGWLGIELYRTSTYLAAATSGMTKKQLLAPFFYFSLAAYLFLLALQCWVLPLGMRSLNRIEERVLNKLPQEVNSLVLGDSGTLFYRYFNPDTAHFSYPILISHWGELFAARDAELVEKGIQFGKTEHFLQEKDSKRWKLQAESSAYFLPLQESSEELRKLARPSEELGIFHLIKKHAQGDKEASLLLFWRLFLPLLSFIVILFPLTQFLTFMRGASLQVWVAIYAFALLTLYLTLRAIQLFVEVGLLPDWSVVILLSFFVGWSLLSVRNL